MAGRAAAIAAGRERTRVAGRGSGRFGAGGRGGWGLALDGVVDERELLERRRGGDGGESGRFDDSASAERAFGGLYDLRRSGSARLGNAYRAGSWPGTEPKTVAPVAGRPGP